MPVVPGRHRVLQISAKAVSVTHELSSHCGEPLGWMLDFVANSWRVIFLGIVLLGMAGLGLSQINVWMCPGVLPAGPHCDPTTGRNCHDSVAALQACIWRVSGIDPNLDKRYGQKNIAQFAIPRLAPDGNFGNNCDLYLSAMLDLPWDIRLEGTGGYQAHMCWKANSGGILTRAHDQLANLYLQGGNCTSGGTLIEDYSGIEIGSGTVIDNVEVRCFQGHGGRASLNYRGPVPPSVLMDSNMSQIRDSGFNSNHGDGLHYELGGANLLVVSNTKAEGNRNCGFWETSLYGGTYISASTQLNQQCNFHATSGVWIHPYSEGNEPLGSFAGGTSMVIGPAGNASITPMGSELNQYYDYIVTPSHIDSGTTGSSLIQRNVTDQDGNGYAAQNWFNVSPLAATGRPFDGQDIYSMLAIGRRTQYGQTSGWWCDMHGNQNYNGFLWSSDHCISDALTVTGRSAIDGQVGSSWSPNGHFEGAAGNYEPQCYTGTASTPPQQGTWRKCDFFRNTDPRSGIFGWVATADGVGASAQWAVVPILMRSR
jgi:hypothetical protein